VGQADDAALGISSTEPDGQVLIVRHPSQLYEASLEGLVLFTHPVVVHEQAAAATGADRSVPDLYGCARFTVEWVRLPDANIGYLVGHWLTMGMLLTTPMIHRRRDHDFAYRRGAAERQFGCSEGP
jgi:phosphatidylglycerol:prolipoprotein diacylglycerol transferase